MKQASQVTLTYEEALEAFFHFINVDDRMLRRQVISHANIPQEIVVTIVDKDNSAEDICVKKIIQPESQTTTDTPNTAKDSLNYSIKLRNIQLPDVIDKLQEVKGLFFVRFSPRADFKPFQCDGFVSQASSEYSSNPHPFGYVPIVQRVHLTTMLNQASALSFKSAVQAAQLVSQYGKPVIEPYGTTEEAATPTAPAPEDEQYVISVKGLNPVEFMSDFAMNGRCHFSKADPKLAIIYRSRAAAEAAAARIPRLEGPKVVTLGEALELVRSPFDSIKEETFVVELTPITPGGHRGFLSSWVTNELVQYNTTGDSQQAIHLSKVAATSLAQYVEAHFAHVTCRAKSLAGCSHRLMFTMRVDIPGEHTQFVFDYNLNTTREQSMYMLGDDMARARQVPEKDVSQLKALIEHYRPSAVVAMQPVLNNLHKLSIPDLKQPA